MQEKGLWAAVIQKAVEDLKQDPRKINRRERKELLEYSAETFFKSQWFEEICGWLNLDPQAIRDRL